MSRISHLIVILLIQAIQSESSGRRMVFRNGKWVFQGELDGQPGSNFSHLNLQKPFNIKKYDSMEVKQ